AQSSTATLMAASNTPRSWASKSRADRRSALPRSRIRGIAVPDASAYRSAWAALVSIALLLASSPLVAGQGTAQPASLAGLYDGRQMEMAAGLELKPDGRFNYALSYGALDEQAAGKWTVSGDRVLLTSNPVHAPRFVLVSRGGGADGSLRVELDV